MLYRAYGETRYEGGTSTSDYRYTGQREETRVGLYYYNATWYDASTGRFIEPDNQPGEGFVLSSLDRYAYVSSNPVRYSDPSGHRACEDQDGGCRGWQNVPSSPSLARQTISRAGVVMGGDSNGWTDDRILALAFAVADVGARFAAASGSDESASSAFQRIYGSVNVNWGNAGIGAGCEGVESFGCTSSAHQINFWSLTHEKGGKLFDMALNFVHEFGHAYNHVAGDGPTSHMRERLVNERMLYLRPNEGGVFWQQNAICRGNPCNPSSEAFADMFIAYVYDAWNTAAVNAPAVLRAKSWLGDWVP